MKRNLAFILALLLLCGLLSGCGSSSYSGGGRATGSAMAETPMKGAYNSYDMAVAEEAYYDEGWYGGDYYYEEPAEAEYVKAPSAAPLRSEVPDTLNLKIIYTADISIPWNPRNMTPPWRNWRNW